MAEAVKVIVRCRPLNRREKDLNCGVVVIMDEKTGLVGLVKPGLEGKKEPPKNFTFDGAFHVDSLTETIYENIAFPLVEGVLEGYNGTVFAYGQTGCGKSFSMTGIEDPATQRGIIPRAFRHIFESVASNDAAKFLIHGSYLEIYNEEIRDLLGKDSKAKMELKEHPDRGVYVKDLTMMSVNSAAEIERVMEIGGKNRSVGATLMNADSSRSHSIFTICLERCDAEADSESGSGLRAGKLNLVDLAGSERQGKTGATGDRLKEATKINLSLSALGNVISALVDGKAKHIPYRDSKLTRMLQDSLGGNTKTLMVACVSPADNNYDETLSTLRYANRAKNIKNKPKINEDPKDALLREYADEITRLKALLSGQGPPAEVSLARATVATGDGSKDLEAAREAAAQAQREAEDIRRQYQQQVQEMQESFQAAQASNEELERSLVTLQRDYSSKEASAKKRLVRAESQVKELSPTHRPHESQDQAGVDAPAGPAAAAAGDEVFAGPPVFGPAGSHALGPGKRPPPGGQPALGAVPEQAAARQRLQQLQGKLVGGERATDMALKQQLQTRRRHADERKEMLAQSVEQDGDLGVMEAIYDNMQDALRAKHKQFEKANDRLKASEAEVKDLQGEFERDRQDYLDTIRSQEKTVLLQKQILEVIVPCLRQNCNYKNVDWVKNTAVWSEEQQTWKLPKLELTKGYLPIAAGMAGGRALNSQREPRQIDFFHSEQQQQQQQQQRQPSAAAMGVRGAADSPHAFSHPMPGDVAAGVMDLDDDLKLRAKLSNSVESDYFRPKRAQQLLAEAETLRRVTPIASPGFQQQQQQLQQQRHAASLPPPSQLPPSLNSVPYSWLGGPALGRASSTTTAPQHPQQQHPQHPQHPQQRKERKIGKKGPGLLEPINKDMYRR